MNLLVVDDDKISVACTLAMLEWQNLGIGQVYTAYSKKQAIEVMEACPVEILLCDIEMPRGSGYELLEWIEENGFSVAAVFLTSYAKFEYVSRAMKMKVVDYVLKPADKDSLEQAVRAAAEHVKREQERRKDEKHALYWDASRQILMRNFWLTVLQRGWTDLSVLQERAQKAGVPLQCGASYSAALVHYAPEQSCYALEQSCYESEQFCYAPAQSDRSKIDERTLGFAVANIAGECLFQQTDSGNVISLGRRRLLLICEQAGAPSAALADRLAHLLREWRKCLAGCRFSIYMLDEKLEAARLPDAAEMLMRHLDGAAYFEPGLHMISEQESRCIPDGGGLIEKAKAYMRANQEKEIGRMEVAEAVHLNPDYLSRLFKSETGRSVIEYLLELRMEEAKKLLVETKEQVSEIAVKVGYSDISYFTKQFKKFFGISPREYRKREGWRIGA